MDETVCPKCNGEETYMDYEDVYERSYAVRRCETCFCTYKIKYQIAIKSIEIIN